MKISRFKALHGIVHHMSVLPKLWALLLALFALPVAAQTFYEVNYIDPDDGQEYTGLMIYHDDAHCKVRFVTDESLAEDQVFETNYMQQSEGKMSKDDIGVMLYIPADEGFPTFFWIWEEDDASDLSDQPYCTYDIDDEDSYFQTEYFREISLSDMDQEYIEQFYSPDEQEYRLLMRGHRSALRTVSVAASANVIASQHSQDIDGTSPIENVGQGPAAFHLLMIANTDVSDIGTACKRDLSNIRSEFSAIARVLGMNYDEHIVSEDQYNKENAVREIQRLGTSSNDVLMFVYTGHGFRFDNQTDFYPNIDLCATSYDDVRQNYASMTDIYNELSNKGARLTIVLSDCCNANIGLESPMINVSSLYARSNNNFDVEKLKTLFLQSSGTVRATSSSPGELSWCGMNGGFFLLSFIESLRTQISPLQEASPSWDNLMNDAIASAKNKSISSSRSKEQNGILSIKTVTR